MREKLARFMAGRNGSDNLTRFLSVLICILLVLSMLVEGVFSRIMWFLALIGIVYVYYRMFSRDLTKRRAENAKYLRATRALRGEMSGQRERWSQRKEFVFFRCPSCRTMLRVPRGKGKIKIVCRKCGNSFIKNT